jgi:hypothetical protein
MRSDDRPIGRALFIMTEFEWGAAGRLGVIAALDTVSIGETGHVAWVKGFVSGPREIGGDYGDLIEAACL